jgi:hypothetical protein
MAALTGEVLEQRDGRWATVHLGHSVRVTDRRRVDPLGLTPQQRAAGERELVIRQSYGFPTSGPLSWWQQAIVDALTRPA